MRIPLDSNSSTPLYKQIHLFLQKQIESGALAPETRLPASRELAASLGVTRLTVSNAYAELEAQALVYSVQGSGIYVARSPVLLPISDRNIAVGSLPLWQQEVLERPWTSVSQELDRMIASVSHPNLISFAEGRGDVNLLSLDDFRKSVRMVLCRDGSAAMGYGDPAGYPPLRARLAQILTSQGVPTHPDDVLITSGAMQALSLVAHLLLRPGDAVLVENPTHTGFIDLCRQMNVELLPVSVDENGMQVNQIEEILRSIRPRLIYTIPNFQNPTGTCLTGDRRRQLVALAERYSVPILENDFVGDLRYEGTAQPALKALDAGGGVIHVGTFSKMLSPGLRVGYLVIAGLARQRLLACKRVNDVATSSLMQRALETYITVGRYEACLRRARAVYGQRRDAMLTALTRYMPTGTRWFTPQGGLFIWLLLPEGLSANQLFPIAGEEGVIYAPGSFSFPQDGPEFYLRLNFAIQPADVIEEGVRRLGRVVERCLESKQNKRAPNHRRTRALIEGKISAERKSEKAKRSCRTSKNIPPKRSNDVQGIN